MLIFGVLDMAWEMAKMLAFLKHMLAVTVKGSEYRGADKFLARPGKKQANVSVRMARISFGALPCRKINRKINDS